MPIRLCRKVAQNTRICTLSGATAVNVEYVLFGLKAEKEQIFEKII